MHWISVRFYEMGDNKSWKMVPFDRPQSFDLTFGVYKLPYISFEA